jgi:uncharacterized tellurite resistance protein B-like protein
MLNRIQTFFDEYMAAGSRVAEEPDAAVRCAAAALLLEMAHMDDAMTPVEQTAIVNAVLYSANAQFSVFSPTSDCEIFC